jgi:hypothetical protein
MRNANKQHQDRVNISNANVFGLSTELGLKKTEFNAALVIFFVPYVLFEIPSNLLLKKLRPKYVDPGMHVYRSNC